MTSSHYSYQVPERHAVFDTPLQGPYPDGSEQLIIGMGCFWGVERLYWQLPGVASTAAGYLGGAMPYPTYAQVCSGRTGHAEVVKVVYQPERCSPFDVFKVFWENHDPTQVDGQGNDIGTQYRSCIYYVTDAQRDAALATQAVVAEQLHRKHPGRTIATSIEPVADHEFYFAEEHHQQYLHKNPGGYCNHGPNGLVCPVPGAAVTSP